MSMLTQIAEKINRKAKEKFHDPKLELMFDVYMLGLEDDRRCRQQEAMRLIDKIENLVVGRKEQA